VAPGEGGQYQHVEVHAGLVCLNGDDMDRAMQLELFESVLTSLVEDPDLTNMCIEASMHVGGIELVRYELPVAEAG
jgi:hypothetical protein